MTVDVLNDSPFSIRDDLRSAINTAWSEISEEGAWLSGEQRLAVAREARFAWGCNLCQQRKEALSPYAIKGEHDQLGELPGNWIEAIHRIVTDSGRITESWYHSTIAAGILEDEFIELLSLTTMVTCVDTFVRGIGLKPLTLPDSASTAEPARKRPGGVETGPGWAPTISPEMAGPELGNYYDNGHQYIRRSLTLVPEELRRFWNLMNALYMANPAVVELEGVDRGISRGQIEFVATRVSAYLDCFY